MKQQNYLQRRNIAKKTNQKKKLKNLNKVSLNGFIDRPKNIRCEPNPNWKT